MTKIGEKSHLVNITWDFQYKHSIRVILLHLYEKLLFFYFCIRYAIIGYWFCGKELIFVLYIQELNSGGPNTWTVSVFFFGQKFLKSLCVYNFNRVSLWKNQTELLQLKLKLLCFEWWNWYLINYTHKYFTYN